VRVTFTALLLVGRIVYKRFNFNSATESKCGYFSTYEKKREKESATESICRIKIIGTRKVPFTSCM
jgi:hypothetical protein